MNPVHHIVPRAHLALIDLAERPGERGQGTVEYVGLVLLIGVVLAGVVKATGVQDNTIPNAIVAKLKAAIESVG